MTSGEAELTGPDLTQGIPLSQLADGAKLVGHADGEAVLLVRKGEEVFGVGATCTHYSGPLGEGLVVGETVRCPWHHACFDLRTGTALRAPALNDIPCWRVEQRDGLVRVAEKKAPAALLAEGAQAVSPVKGGDEPAIIVIVGAGAAGNAAAETLRRLGYGGDITMIGVQDNVPVDRPNLSKDYLAGTAPAEWVPLRSPEFYRENGIRLLLGESVESIDVKARKVNLSSGPPLAYDRLLLATGAEPVRLTMPGGDLPHVHYLRTLRDSRAIIAAAEQAKRAVVLGASFIGLEVAASLRTRGLAVDVVAPDRRPMERTLGAEIGDFIRGLHEEHGVTFHLEQTAAAIDRESVTLTNGERLPADLVVIGVGVRPSVTLAERAGLQMDRGVSVDEYLETSAPGIFAAGDIARWPDARSGERIRVEHWVVAERQGQAAAHNMLGQRRPFDAVPFFWSQHYDVPICYVGHAAQWDRIDVAGSITGLDCMVAYRSGGRTLAVASIYRDRESLLAEAAFERGDEEILQHLVPPGVSAAG